MSDAVISFTTIEYPDEASMDRAREVFRDEMGPLADRLRPLGMTKFHSSRMFLPEGKFMIGNWLEYRDMAAYEACDRVWQEAGAEFAEHAGRDVVERRVAVRDVGRGPGHIKTRKNNSCDPYTRDSAI